MAGLCPSSCTDITLLQNPTSACSTDIRQKTLSRLFFFPCNTSLPSPITPTAIKALFDDGTIVSTNRLANITVADPQTEDIVIDECSPTRKVITTRTINFEDRIAVSATSGSPATTNKFFDYDFWADKLQYEFQVSYMWAYCDGDVIIPVDANGNPLSATILGFLSWQKPSQQGGAWVEFKKLELTFLGDPFALSIKPAFNWITAGITL